MSESEQIDRRRWQRLQISLPVFVRWLDKNDRKVTEFATAVNIGAGGALLTLQRPLATDTRITLHFPPAPLSSDVQGTDIQATVLRATAAEASYLIAAEFEEPITAARSATSIT